MKTKSMFTRALSVAIGMLALMMMAFTATPAFALGTDWDGGTGNWSDSNWSSGQAPDPAGAMTINAGAVTVTASTTAGSLTLGAASLTVNAGQDLAVSGTVAFDAGSTSSGPGTITATGAYSTTAGTVTIGANLAGSGGVAPQTWDQPSVTILTGANTYSGVTMGNWQQRVRADEGVGLSPNTVLNVGNESTFETGVDLVRPGGTGAGQMTFTSVAYALGLAAVGGPVKVCFGTLAAPEALAWNEGNFRIDGDQNNTDNQLVGLILNGRFKGTSATHPIEFVNPIDLGLYNAAKWPRGISTPSAFASTMSGVLSGTRGIIKRGTGELILTAKNTYNGPTVISAGTLTLADNAELTFVIPATQPDGNSTITGAGTAVLNGDFHIDTALTDATALLAGTWQLENVTSLSGAYGSSFQVVDGTSTPWMDAGSDTWTTTVAGRRVYTFDETTGTLTLSEGPAPGTVITLY
jgi:autotransporter-associated beta strand protein